MRSRSSVVLFRIAMGLTVAIGLAGWGCKQEPDKVYVTNTFPNETFYQLFLTLAPDCLLVPGVDNQLRATALFTNEAQQDWTNRVTWSVADTGFGSITPAGVFRAKRSGSGEVRAVSPEGWLGQEVFRVSDLTGLQATLSDPIAFVGDTAQVTLRAVLNNEGLQAVPARIAVNWMLSDPSVAQFSSLTHLVALQTGQTAIVASILGVASHPALLTVDSIISLACGEVSSGPYLAMDTVRFDAVATTRLSRTIPVNDRARWMSSDPARLMYIDDGAFIATAAGFYGVHAEMAGQSSAEMPVDIWNVTGLAISPIAVDTVHRGDTLQFSAMADIENHGSADMTAHALWTSTDHLAGNFSAPGLFIAGSAGITLVQARIGVVMTPEVRVVVGNTPVFYETFETYPVGNFTGGTLWNVNTASAGRVLVTNVASAGTKSCMLLDTTYYSDCSIRTRSGLFNPVIRGVAEADLRTDGNGLAMEILTSYDYTVAYVEFREGSMYAAQNNGDVFLQAYQPATWYHISMVFDCDTDSYDVFVNGTQRATDLSFYYTTTSIGGVWVGVMNGLQGMHSYVDNVSLSE